VGAARVGKKKAKARRADSRPGQSLTLKWPVLHYGSVPHFDGGKKWGFQDFGEKWKRR